MSYNTYEGKVLAGGKEILVSGPLYKPGMNGRSAEELERFPSYGILWAENLDGCCGEMLPFVRKASAIITSSDSVPESIGQAVEESGITVIGGLDLNQILDLCPVSIDCRRGTVKEIGYAYYCCK